MLNVQNTLVSIRNCSEEKGKAELALASLRQLNDDPPGYYRIQCKLQPAKATRNL